MGDVFNNSGYPFIDAANGGSLDGVIAFCQSVLDQINDDTTVIPGHGPIASKQNLQDYLSMLTQARANIMALIEAGKSLEEVHQAGVTAKWDKQMGVAQP